MKNYFDIKDENRLLIKIAADWYRWYHNRNNDTTVSVHQSEVFIKRELKTKLAEERKNDQNRNNAQLAKI